jgi:hypothetical protein
VSQKVGMSQDLLRQEIQKLKEFVSDTLTPGGVLFHHLQLLIQKLENESALISAAAISGRSAQTPNISLKFLISNTQSVVVSNLSPYITTKDLLVKVHVRFSILPPS